MIKTTVYLPENLKRDLERIAAQRSSSEAEVIREALAKFVDERPRRKPSMGLFSSGDPTLAERVDEVLAEDGFGER